MSKPASSDVLLSLQGALPTAILDLIKKDGFADYWNGALRFVNPMEWGDVVGIWTNKFPESYPFLITAFGDFYFWADNAIWICLVQHGRIMFCMENPDSFVNDFITDENYLKDFGFCELNRRGLAAVGPRKENEIYVWEPAFALGGSQDTSSIGKGDVRVAMKILASLQETIVQNI